MSKFESTLIRGYRDKKKNWTTVLLEEFAISCSVKGGSERNVPCYSRVITGEHIETCLY